MTKMDYDTVVGALMKKRGYARVVKDYPIEKDKTRSDNFEEFLRKTRKRKLPRLSFQISCDFGDKLKFRTSPENLKVRKKAKVKEELESEKMVEKESIPDKFLNHILALGFDKKDAAALYEHKDEWVAVKLDTKIKCTAQGCDFEVEMGNECLVEHCSRVHSWRDYPCHYKNCNWVSYSATSNKSHISRFHEAKSTSNNLFKCDFADCNASFSSDWKLQHHLNIHKNITYDCHYCSYRSAEFKRLTYHMNKHYGKKSFKCELCGNEFLTSGSLNRHVEEVHEAVQYECPLCDKRSNITSVRHHIRNTHKIVGASFDRSKKMLCPSKIEY